MSHDYDYPTLAAQRQYWDRRWDETKTPNEWSLKRGEAILTFLQSFRLDHPTIIDLGCGTGWFTKKLSQLGQVTGIDLSDKAIAIAKSRFPGIPFLAGNLFEIRLPAEHFEVAVSQEVIAHVQDQAAYLDRVASVLKPGGYLIITTANKFVMDRLDWPSQPPGHIEQWLDFRSLRRLLGACFHVQQLTTVIPMGNRGLLRLINSNKFNTTLGFVISQRYLEAAKEWAGFGYTLIAVARKKV